MFEEEKQRISDYRKTRKILNIVWVGVKLTIAFALISYIDYGMFIVMGYILYALENNSGIQFINSQETDLQLNILHQRINQLENKDNENKL